MSLKEKYRQIKKEAAVCVIGLIVLIIFWIVAGFGVSRLDITVYHTPLWAITGCIGTWLFSVVMVVWMIKKVFKDFSLEDEDEKE
ncbi:MAG TPA: YhdT family protein [Candidatus Fimousia stercorigallinarum]|nr:YhdT family protein [Candidatus Fimousia stercorigallinarum]